MNIIWKFYIQNVFMVFFLFEYKYVMNINFRKFSNIRKYGPMKK